MMDPAKPGSRTRPQVVAPKPRLRTPSDEALFHRWDPQPNVSPLMVLNSRSGSPPPQPAKRSTEAFALEHAKLYPSYTLETGLPEMPYETHVQGWLYAPGINRKGRLMTAAVERLIGNPGKYNSIADAAAHAQAEESLGDVEESSSGGWMGLRPAMFRTKSSKNSVNSQPTSANTSRNNSQSNSRVTSRATSPEPEEAKAPSTPADPEASAGSTPLHSPGSSPSTGVSPAASIEDISSMNDNTPPKRPGMRRTATYTFDARSNPKGKGNSGTAQTRREQKHIVRERLAAITHKSLAMRDVQISVLSTPDSKGHRKKRTFWTETDDSGRFSHMCRVPFRPERVRANSGSAIAFSECYLVQRSGVSVISDIDDTVRHTGVTKSKRELLQNVLVKGFDDCQVDGVRDWFQRMAQAGATFHYVSNSPWQLFDVVHGYLDHHGFPEGSIHLKKYAGVFDGLTESPKGRKRASLEKIMRDFPKRRFLLVGDSGEADLEAYSELARKFPDQILAIYIRDITIPADEPLFDPRARTTHRRHHSADLVSLDSPPDLPARPGVPEGPPPALPPRHREAPELPTRRPLTENAQKPAPDTISAIVDSAESPSGSPVLERANSPASSESTSNIAPQLPTITTTPTTKEPPKLPPRPKLLRRTSSKLLDSVNAVASASSHAVNSAARFLGPHQQPSSSHGTSNAAPEKQGQVLPPKPKLKPSQLAVLTLGDEVPEAQQSSAWRKANVKASGSRATSPSRSNTSPASPNVFSEANENGVFISSSQDFIDIDRVDKRAEQWKMRLAKQHRLLPPHVELKAWRQPSDVEAQSMRLIKGDDSLI